jgi:hypothetical protein
VTKRSAELSWTKPAKDGGAPIMGYILQKKKVSDPDWTRCNEVPTKEVNMVVTGLEENEQYEFRVIAVNQVCNGVHLIHTMPVSGWRR